MKMTTQTEFGRQDTCVQPKSGPDKWALLSALTDSAESFGLSHRTLGVLRALLTFLPERTLPLQPEAAIVFPSNRTLSNRLNGMPESTLRRHLAHLVRAGIVSRKSSPNGKRYARKIGSQTGLAFGFDLAPLAWRAEEITTTAEMAKMHREQCRVLRDRILTLRQTLLAARIEPNEELSKFLRRKLSKEQLEVIHDELASLVPTVDERPETQYQPLKTSISDSQNERHIQYVSKLDSVSEDIAPADFTLNDLMSKCHETSALFPQTPRSWAELVLLASHLAPMLGIDLPVWHEASQRLGRIQAAIAVLCIHEKLAVIRSPGAYLRSLSKKAVNGRFEILPMLTALKHQGSENCQLTIRS